LSASAIEWTDAVWNPVTGCDRVSPGCAHCYALELAPRLRAMHAARGGGKWADAPDGTRASSGPAFGVKLHPNVLEQPLRWRRPRRVFVNSMSDLFHEDVPYQFIAEVFDVMRRCPDHTFQVLTKRPERMQRWLSWESPFRFDEPLPNVWLGVSIENRRFVYRADVLRDTPAAVRFISAEPLLGQLTDAACICCLKPVGHYDLCLDCANNLCVDCGIDEETGEPWGSNPEPYDRYPDHRLSLHRIDWLIVGGESGPRHRPIRPEWVRDLRDAARAAGTPFFFKQWGGRTPKAGGRELDGRTWDEMPEDR